jgi:WD40 repeat protein
VKLWDVGSGQLLRTFAGDARCATILLRCQVTSVAWNPDGKTLAAGSMDRTVKLLDAGSGQLLRTLSGHDGVLDSLHQRPFPQAEIERPAPDLLGTSPRTEG